MNIVCRKRTSLLVLNSIGFVFSLIFSLFLTLSSIADTSFLWLAIGSWVFISFPAFYHLLYNGYNRIEVDEFEITFVNSFFQRKRKFKHSEMTYFNSYRGRHSIGARGGTYAGMSYTVCELQFGKNFSYQISEHSFDENYNKLKFFIGEKWRNKD